MSVCEALRRGRVGRSASSSGGNTEPLGHLKQNLLGKSSLQVVEGYLSFELSCFFSTLCSRLSSTPEKCLLYQKLVNDLTYMASQGRPSCVVLVEPGCALALVHHLNRPQRDEVVF